VTTGRRGGAGFTLVELITTVAVASILVAVAVPAFRGLVVDHRTTALVNEVVTALNLARSEAIKRGTQARFVRHDATCGDYDPEDDDEPPGWSVYVDKDLDGDLTDELDAGDFLRTWTSVCRGPEITGAPATIVFTSLGGVDAQATISVDCSGCGEGHGREIAVGLNGRISVAHVSSGA